jgi:hypothetical protein
MRFWSSSSDCNSSDILTGPVSLLGHAKPLLPEDASLDFVGLIACRWYCYSKRKIRMRMVKHITMINMNSEPAILKILHIVKEFVCR